MEQHQIAVLEQTKNKNNKKKDVVQRMLWYLPLQIDHKI
jgi:hypothetical protein